MQLVILSATLVLNILAYYACTTLGRASTDSQYHLSHYANNSGAVYSPFFPFDYGDHQDVKYRIYFKPGNTQRQYVCFTFIRFELEDNHDYVTFHNDSLRTARYSGRGTLSRAAHGSYSTVWVDNFCWLSDQKRYYQFEFHTDIRIVSRGFYATYRVLYDATPTPGTQLHLESSSFLCFSNRELKTSAEVCDGHLDCRDASDESYAHARCTQTRHEFAASYGLGRADITATDFPTSINSRVEVTPRNGFRNVRSAVDVYENEQNPFTDVNENSYFLIGTRFLHRSGNPGYFEQEEPVWYRSGNYCMEFWYRMQGADAGRLALYLHTEQLHPENYEPLWSRAGSYGLTWRLAQVQIELTARVQARLLILAEAGSDDYSMIAVDNLYFRSGECLLPRRDISCGFEAGLCGWSSNILVPSRFVHHQYSNGFGNGYRILPASGIPKRSHQFVRKYYRDNHAFVLTPGAAVRLISPPMHLDNDIVTACLRLWYRTDSNYDDHTLRLEIFIRDHNGIKSDFAIVGKGGGHNNWTFIAQDFTVPTPSLFMLEIELDSSMSNDNNNIAIDDISVIPGTCNEIVHSMCSPTQFRCSNAIHADCIPQAQFCDNHEDCPDGSDEHYFRGCHSQPGFHCPISEFYCDSSRTCIPEIYRCNGQPDCQGGEDEAQCNGVTSTYTRLEKHAPHGMPPGVIGGIISGVIVAVFVVLSVVIVIVVRKKQFSHERAQRAYTIPPVATISPTTVTLTPPPYSNQPPSYNTDTYTAESSDNSDAPPTYDSVANKNITINVNDASAVYINTATRPPPRYSELDPRDPNNRAMGITINRGATNRQPAFEREYENIPRRPRSRTFGGQRSPGDRTNIPHPITGQGALTRDHLNLSVECTETEAIKESVV